MLSVLSCIIGMYDIDSILHTSGLEVYTSYAVSVAAKTVVGVGPYSEAITVRTLESCKFNSCNILCIDAYIIDHDLGY